MAGNDISQSGYIQILQGIGAPVTALNLKFLQNWHAAENSDASYNAFNTTKPMPGSTDLGGPTANNGHPVQIYTSEQQGIAATIATLKEKPYKGIVDALKSGSTISAGGGQIYRAAAELVVSPWGTHNIADPLTGKNVDGSSTKKIVLPDYGVGPTVTWGPNGIPKGYGSVGGVTETSLTSLFSWMPQALKMGLGIMLIIIGIYVMAHGEQVAAVTKTLGAE